METKQLNIENDNTTRKFSFGEWVLVDGEKSGQVVDFYGDGIYTVDFDGVWNFVNVKRIVKDEKYKSANGL